MNVSHRSAVGPCCPLHGVQPHPHWGAVFQQGGLSRVARAAPRGRSARGHMATALRLQRCVVEEIPERLSALSQREPMGGTPGRGILGVTCCSPRTAQLCQQALAKGETTCVLLTQSCWVSVKTVSLIQPSPTARPPAGSQSTLAPGSPCLWLNPWSWPRGCKSH